MPKYLHRKKIYKSQKVLLIIYGCLSDGELCSSKFSIIYEYHVQCINIRLINVDMLNAVNSVYGVKSVQHSVYPHQPYIGTLYIFTTMLTQTKTSSHRD